MGRRIRTKSVVVFLIVVMSLTVFPNSVFASDGWKQDKNGWWYAVGDSYYKNQWAKIGSNWYYFNQQGYMESNCYRDGYWLSSSGAWNQDYSHGTWKKNNTGWWYEDNGWYPVNQWMWIDGKCYYFDSEGYMESDCYRDGYWLFTNGACDLRSGHSIWKKDSKGWRYEDDGWYPKNQWLYINGTKYWFGKDGYWISSPSDDDTENNYFEKTYRSIDSFLNHGDNILPDWDSSGFTDSQKEQISLLFAQNLANYCRYCSSTDLEAVKIAAQNVAYLSSKCEYTTEDPDYKTAYGVFCKGVYTCAGSARALGMVLDCMGLEWKHFNEHQWHHQWCEGMIKSKTGSM